MAALAKKRRKRLSTFQLLPTDGRILFMAIDAWRMAALHYQRVSIEHCVDQEKFHRMDEFSTPRCRRENESYFAEQLLEDAKHVLGRAALGERPSAPHAFLINCMKRKDFRADRRISAVADALEAVRKAMSPLSGEERFFEAMDRAEKKGIV